MSKKYLYLRGLLFLSLVLSLVSTSEPRTPRAAQAADIIQAPILPGWSRYQPVTVNNSTGNTLIDYQVQIDLNSGNFTFADARTDGSDIRFTDEDETTLLSYWLESYNAVTQTGRLWVKVPSIPVGAKTIWLVYGNLEATPFSNGTATFEYFDDFELPFSMGGDPLSNASNYQTTPTYDGSGQVVHPDVLYFPGGWNGFDYWMGITPYPNGNAYYENPSILASHDGITWQVPPGLVNPIAQASDNNLGDVADPELFYDSSTNQLWAYYLDQNHALSTTYLKRQPSSDGINWGPEETCETVVIDKILSPAIVKIDSTYYMWSVNMLSYSAGTTQVEFRTSSDGCIWSAPQIVSISLPGYYVWHIDVVYVASLSEYRMVFAAYPNTSFGSGNTVLYYATSTDRLNWTTYSKIALGKGSGWDSGQIYRSSLIYDETNNLLRVWYSARGGSGWHLGYTERDFDDFIADLTAEDAWSIRQGDGTWTRSQEQAYKGSYSAKLVQGSGANMIVTHPQGINNDFYQEWNLYDDMDSSAFKVVRVMNSASETVGAGVWTGASASMYAFHDKAYIYSITTIPRTLGWHKFGILLRSDSSATFYIDDQEAGSLTAQFNNAAFIDVEGYATGSTTYYVDDLRLRKHTSPEPTTSLEPLEPPGPADWYDYDWGYRCPSGDFKSGQCCNGVPGRGCTEHVRSCPCGWERSAGDQQRWNHSDPLLDRDLGLRNSGGYSVDSGAFNSGQRDHDLFLLRQSNSRATHTCGNTTHWAMDESSR